jgi:hypothetical protein
MVNLLHEKSKGEKDDRSLLPTQMVEKIYEEFKKLLFKSNNIKAIFS